jgi:hypothetical protein
LILPGLEVRLPGHRARSHSLYRLRYPGSTFHSDILQYLEHGCLTKQCTNKTFVSTNLTRNKKIQAHMSSYPASAHSEHSEYHCHSSWYLQLQQLNSTLVALYGPRSKSLWLYRPHGSWPLFRFLNLYTVGRTPWRGISPSQGRNLHTEQTPSIVTKIVTIFCLKKLRYGAYLTKYKEKWNVNSVYCIHFK